MTFITRILPFILEFCIFIFFAVFLTYKKYKRNNKIIGNIIGFAIAGIITLLFFAFGYADHIFFSYIKMLTVGLIIFATFMIYIGNKKEKHGHYVQAACLYLSILLPIVLLLDNCCGNILFDFCQKKSMQIVTSKVTPTINGKDGIGILLDDNGYLEGFIFSYVENGENYHVNINHDELENTKVDINDDLSKPYVIKTTTIIIYTDNEKINNQRLGEEMSTYEIHVNSSQMMGFKT